MSNQEQLAEGTSLTETLVDTVKTELIYKLKLCIDEINTEVDKVTYENIRSYEKMNKVLANLRKLDPNWTINGGFDKPGMWDLTDMLEGILKHRIIDIEIDDQNVGILVYLPIHLRVKVKTSILMIEQMQVPHMPIDNRLYEPRKIHY